MTSFIEVRRASGGKPILVNMAAIEGIHDLGQCRRITYIGGSAARDPGTLDVMESYDDLKALVGAKAASPR